MIEAKRFIKGINNMKEAHFDENELAKRWAQDIYNKFDTEETPYRSLVMQSKCIWGNILQLHG